MKDISALRNDFAAAAYILNEDKSKVFLVFHKKTEKWLPPGGHVDPNELPHEAAAREALEETGLEVKPFGYWKELDIDSETNKQLPTPYCVVHEIYPETTKDVEHMHVDFCYLFEVLHEEQAIKADEIKEMRWFTKDELDKLDTYPGVKAIVRSILQ